MILRPFRALRPLPEKAPYVSAVPYDVVNREEAAGLAAGNALSFLHVSRPEIDLPPQTDAHAGPVYEQARKAFTELREKAPLIEEAAPTLYLYRLRQGAHSQIGICATYSVTEYDQGGIAKHEKTRPDKEDDRTRHVLTLRSQTGPAYLAYRGREEINSRITKHVAAEKPLFDFTAVDGVTHTIWAVAPGPLQEHLIYEMAKVPRLYIADGHHRSASASRAHAELGKGDTQAAHAFFLAVAFPAEQLRILPYHRVVKNLGKLSVAEFVAEVSERFELAPCAANPEPRRGEFAMYLRDTSGKGRWTELKPKRPATGSATERLDVSILQDQLLAPVLGISDPRTDQRIDFVGGSRGTAELQRRVDSGECAVAFALHPTSLDDVMSVSDAGGIMPPKSTWFEPKLRDGLLSHEI